MFQFLKIQYELGNITKEVLKTLVPKRISDDEYKTITGEDFSTTATTTDSSTATTTTDATTPTDTSASSGAAATTT